MSERPKAKTAERRDQAPIERDGDSGQYRELRGFNVYKI